MNESHSSPPNPFQAPQEPQTRDSANAAPTRDRWTNALYVASGTMMLGSYLSPDEVIVQILSVLSLAALVTPFLIRRTRRGPGDESALF